MVGWSRHSALREFFWIIQASAGLALLLWPLWNTLNPVPGWPDKLWPYVVMMWLIFGSLRIFVLRRKSILKSLEPAE
jgi:hypothetical protein